MSVVVTDPFAGMRAEIERAGQRSDVPAEEKLTALREMESDLVSLLGLIGQYRGDLHLEQETRDPLMQEAIFTLRQDAAIRETLVSRGILTGEELDALGMLSHDDIAKLDEEGLLEAWVLEEWPHVEYNPMKHPRGRGGKWIDVLGRAIKPQSRSGGRSRAARAGAPEPAGGVPRRAERAAASAERGARGATGDAERPARAATRDATGPKPEATPDGPVPVADTLKQVREAGLDEWPKKGDEATRLLGDANDTRDLHTVTVRGSGSVRRYTPERQKLHDSIIDTLLRKRMEVLNDRGETELHPDPNGEFLAKPEGTPRALFMAGGTASGKSTALSLAENADVTPPDAVHIDPDEIKSMIPEYVQMVRAKDKYAANGVHEESSDIASRLKDEAHSRGLNIVLDGTGDSGMNADGQGKFASKIKSMKDSGYDTHLFYVNAPTEMAVERAIDRAYKTGRWVPTPEIRKQHKTVSARFDDSVKPLIEDGTVSSVRMYDTTGDPPTLFASGGNGRFEVHDQALHDAFIAKAKEADAAPGSSAEHPIDVGGDVGQAAKLLAEGKHVRLNQPREVSTLLDKLNEIVAQAKERGERAPTFDLCRVSVKGTNLFCVGSKGIDRVDMPQLKGTPEPGSKADGLPKNDLGRVSLDDQFIEHLTSKGVNVEEGREKASYLRASQRELNGAKVAGIARSIEGGKEPKAIFVSRDNYIVDGHHNWAGVVGADTRDNKTGDLDMPIRRIDMPILDLLDEARTFTREWGIAPQGVEDASPGRKKPVATPLT